MGNYVTDNGFIKPTWQEFLLKTKNRMYAIWGSEFDAGDTTPAGLLAGIMARSLADSADADQEIYASLDPLQAQGEALSRIAALRGTWRQSSAPSRAKVACYCEGLDEGLVISSSAVVRRVRGAVTFSADDSIEIVRSNLTDVYLSAEDDFTIGTVVTVTFSFGSFSTTVNALGTLVALQDLATQINAAWPLGFAQAYDSAPSADFVYSERALRVWLPGGTFALQSFTSVELAMLGTAGYFLCTTDGPVEALAGEITAIDTAESGWVACNNLVAAAKGRNDETDEALRIRMYLRDGKATESAIRKKVLNDVAGVSGCSVRSNRTMILDADGRRPKCFEVTVEGGEDQEIADAIWDVAPGGIEIFADPLQGGIHCMVTDVEGRPQDVWFSRPISRVLHAKIYLKRYTEESLPGTGIEAIRSAILSWAATEFTAGQNVIPSRFNVPIYSVPGIGKTTIYVAVTDSVNDTPTYGVDEIEVGGRVSVVLTEQTLLVEIEV